MKSRFLASGAACALLASPALANDLTISSKTTSAVDTAAAANNTPGNITINSSGSVEVSKNGPAVLLNSNNTISNSGTISNPFGTGATGITIVPGYTGSVTNSGTINVITTGTAPTTSGQFGILLMNGNNVNFNGTAATASTSLTASSVVGVIEPGELISSATGVTNGTFIVNQSSGTAGGAGVYVLSQPTTAALNNTAFSATGSNFVASGSGTTLTVTSVTGILLPGNIVSGSGVPDGTTIVSQQSGTPGGVGVYTTSQATTAAGVTLLAFPKIAPFTGDIVTKSGSTITVAGFGADGIGILSELNGNLTQGGTITSQGTTSSGIVAQAAIDKAFVNTGTVQTAAPTGVTVATSTSILSPGWAVALGGNVGGGILNAGPVSATDNTAAAVISTIGASPALIVAPTVASDTSSIAIGLVSDANAPGFSIINRGKITSTAGQPGVSPITVQIGNAPSDTSGVTTTLAGGFYNSGTISAVATSDSQIPLQLAPSASSATAMMIGVGATVPTLTNTATGAISATTTGPKGGTATALVIEGTSQIQSTASGLTGGSLQSLNNAGSITANAVSSDTTITGLSAFGIQDLGGTLTSVTNSGTISATATLLDNRSQTTIAADLSQNTKAVSFVNSGTVTGDVLFPNVANNQLTIEGANAKLSGQIRSTGLGSVNIAVSAGGTGGILHTAAVVNGGNITVGPKGTLDVEIGTSTTVVSASGPVSFDAASHVTVTPVAILPANTSIRLVHSDTSLTFGNFAATTSTIQVPFLFTGSVSEDSNNLTLTLQRKTAAQLGLTGNAATIYQPAITAALRDTQLAAALGLLTSSGAVETTLNQLLPVSNAADNAVAAQLSDPYTNGAGVRQRSLLLGTLPESGFNPWLQGSFDIFSGSGANRYSDHGAGGTLGLDFTDAMTRGHFGIALSIQQTHVTDKAPAAATEQGSWYLISPYMGIRSDNVFLDIQLNGGGSSIQQTRTVTIGSLSRVATSTPTMTLASGSITGGYIWNVGGVQLMPQVTLNGVGLFHHNYIEQGGGAGVDLTVSSSTQDDLSAFAGLGAGASYNWLGGRFVPQVLAAYGHEIIGGNNSGTTAAFGAIPFSNFTVSGTPLMRSEVVGGFSLDFISGGVSIGASYNAARGSSFLSQTARITFSTQF